MEANDFKRALVADDDDDARLLLSAIVRRAGYEVIEAADGQELVEQAQALQADDRQLDLVVSDIGMPRCTGIEAALALRAFMPRLPIVLVTAFRDASTLLRARALQVSAVLSKPVDAGALIQLLHRIRADN